MAATTPRGRRRDNRQRKRQNVDVANGVNLFSHAIAS
jgi:hypothetical protein